MLIVIKKIILFIPAGIAADRLAGTSYATMLPLKASIPSFNVVFFSLGIPATFAYTKDTNINTIPIIIPGRIPATNNSATDTPISVDKIIIGRLGGIITPNEPALAMIVAANPFEYPFLAISGIVMPPSAAVAATPDPEIAPMNMPAKAQIIPKPP